MLIFIKENWSGYIFEKVDFGTKNFIKNKNAVKEMPPPRSFSKGSEAYNLIPSSIPSAKAVTDPAVKTAGQPSACNHTMIAGCS